MTVEVFYNLYWARDGGSLGIHLGPPKTPASSRTIPVPQAVAELLLAHVETFGSGPHGVIFSNHDGELIDRTRFSEQWRPAARAAGLPAGQGMHSLRHFYASLLIREGCSVQSCAGPAGSRHGGRDARHLCPPLE